MPHPPSLAALAMRCRSIVLLTLALQFALVATGFPIGELLTPTPLLHIDAPHHWYQIDLAVQLARQGRLVGYDPTFAAGYLGGIIYNTSARLPALLAVVFAPWLTPAVAFKLVSFTCAVVGPAAVPAAARVLGLRPAVSAVAAGLTIVLWWASPIHWYHTAGVVAWAFAVLAAIWFAARIVTVACGEGTTGGFVLLCIAGAVLFLAHPVFPVATGFAMLPLLVARRHALSATRLPLWLVLLPVACLVPNLPWILATLQHPGMADGAQPYQQVVDLNMVWQDMLGLPGAGRGSHFHAILVFLSCCAAARARQLRERQLARALLAAALALLVFAATGSMARPLAILQTNRFVIQAYVLLTLPAAIGLLAIVQDLRATGARRLAALGAAALALPALLYCINEVRQELSPGRRAYYGSAPPQVHPLGPTSRWALERVCNQTDPGARVLFELSLARVHDGGHMAGYLASRCAREFIGGAYPFTHFASFQDGEAFGQPIGDLPPAMFRQTLERYNVGWLLVHSPRSRRYLARLPFVTLISEGQGLAFYRTELPHTYFLQGSGTVRARGANHVDLADLVGATIVLKYHYLPGMRTEPPARIDGVRVGDDPTPFVRIRQPPAQLRLGMP